MHRSDTGQIVQLLALELGINYVWGCDYYKKADFTIVPWKRHVTRADDHHPLRLWSARVTVEAGLYWYF
jgi:hypothetical protein